MSDDEVVFGVVGSDGVYAHTKTIKRSDILACPFAILVPEHYREDGTCRCSDPEHRAFMKAEWEYTDADFVAAGVIANIEAPFNEGGS